ncbi:MAG: hypothetical protein KIH10_10480, partial [Candidatus Freyarchaeota archaeon]|nr:hypothetical protein [Candidatus Jordarchaeia archaeon]
KKDFANLSPGRKPALIMVSRAFSRERLPRGWVVVVGVFLLLRIIKVIRRKIIIPWRRSIFIM